jgi:ABC-2 type transport system permease protein
MMKQQEKIEEIWKARSHYFYNELMSYWRLIGASGLLATVVVLFILGVLYYQEFMDWIPHGFPVAGVLALLFAFFITRAPHRTLLEEADILFLTPLEKQMEGYFQQAFVYNLLVQTLGIAILLVICSPLYANMIAKNNDQLLLYFIIPMILNGWNLASSWTIQRLQDERKGQLHFLCRFLFHALFLYWFFTNGPIWWLLIFSMLIMLLFLFDRQVKKDNGYHWLHLLEMENRLKARFYHFASMFVDVPHLQSRVNKRMWLSFITRWLPFNSSQAYRYLYLKTFVRANDYLGIFLRLLLVGIVVVYSIPDYYGQVVAYLLFLYMMSVQLKAMHGHHQRQFWFKLFPLPNKLLLDSFIWLTFVLLVIQSVVMIIPVFLKTELLGNSILLLLLGFLFSYSYCYLYLKGHLLKKSK